MFSMLAPLIDAEEWPKKLTTNPYEDHCPCWSPDGSKILYTAKSDDWYQAVWIMNADGTNKMKISDGIRHVQGPGQARFSPDGTRIVFVEWTWETNHRIYVMDSDGSNIKQLTFEPDPIYTDQYPNWSPDGTKIIFGHSRPGEGHLYTMDRFNRIKAVN